jgi:hypothetical protein
MVSTPIRITVADIIVTTIGRTITIDLTTIIVTGTAVITDTEALPGLNRGLKKM